MEKKCTVFKRKSQLVLMFAIMSVETSTLMLLPDMKSDVILVEIKPQSFYSLWIKSLSHFMSFSSVS